MIRLRRRCKDSGGTTILAETADGLITALQTGPSSVQVSWVIPGPDGVAYSINFSHRHAAELAGLLALAAQAGEAALANSAKADEEKT